MIYVKEITKQPFSEVNPGMSQAAEVTLIVTDEHIGKFIDAFSNPNCELDGNTLLAAFGLKNKEDKMEIQNLSGRAIDL